MDFHELPRRDLQALCKRNGVRANMTNAAMADALSALPTVDGVEEYIKQPAAVPEPAGKAVVAEEEVRREKQGSPLPRGRRVAARKSEAVKPDQGKGKVAEKVDAKRESNREEDAAALGVGRRGPGRRAGPAGEPAAKQGSSPSRARREPVRPEDGVEKEEEATIQVAGRRGPGRRARPAAEPTANVAAVKQGGPPPRTRRVEKEDLKREVNREDAPIQGAGRRARGAPAVAASTADPQAKAPAVEKEEMKGEVNKEDAPIQGAELRGPSRRARSDPVVAASTADPQAKAPAVEKREMKREVNKKEAPIQGAERRGPSRRARGVPVVAASTADPQAKAPAVEKEEKLGSTLPHARRVTWKLPEPASQDDNVEKEEEEDTKCVANSHDAPVQGMGLRDRRRRAQPAPIISSEPEVQAVDELDGPITHGRRGKYKAPELLKLDGGEEDDQAELEQEKKKEDALAQNVARRGPSRLTRTAPVDAPVTKGRDAASSTEEPDVPVEAVQTRPTRLRKLTVKAAALAQEKAPQRDNKKAAPTNSNLQMKKQPEDPQEAVPETLSEEVRNDLENVEVAAGPQNLKQSEAVKEQSHEDEGISEVVINKNEILMDETSEEKPTVTNDILMEVGMPALLSEEACHNLEQTVEKDEDECAHFQEGSGPSEGRLAKGMEEESSHPGKVVSPVSQKLNAPLTAAEPAADVGFTIDSEGAGIEKAEELTPGSVQLGDVEEIVNMRKAETVADEQVQSKATMYEDAGEDGFQIDSIRVDERKSVGDGENAELEIDKVPQSISTVDKNVADDVFQSVPVDELKLVVDVEKAQVVTDKLPLSTTTMDEQKDSPILGRIFTFAEQTVEKDEDECAHFQEGSGPSEGRLEKGMDEEGSHPGKMVSPVSQKLQAPLTAAEPAADVGFTIDSEGVGIEKAEELARASAQLEDVEDDDIQADSVHGDQLKEIVNMKKAETVANELVQSIATMHEDVGEDGFQIDFYRFDEQKFVSDVEKAELVIDKVPQSISTVDKNGGEDGFQSVPVDEQKLVVDVEKAQLVPDKLPLSTITMDEDVSEKKETTAADLVQEVIVNNDIVVDKVLITEEMQQSTATIDEVDAVDDQLETVVGDQLETFVGDQKEWTDNELEEEKVAETTEEMPQSIGTMDEDVDDDEMETDSVLAEKQKEGATELTGTDDEVDDEEEIVEITEDMPQSIGTVDEYVQEGYFETGVHADEVKKVVAADNVLEDNEMEDEDVRKENTSSGDLPCDLDILVDNITETMSKITITEPTTSTNEDLPLRMNSSVNNTAEPVCRDGSEKNTDKPVLEKNKTENTAELMKLSRRKLKMKLKKALERKNAKRVALARVDENIYRSNSTGQEQVWKLQQH